MHIQTFARLFEIEPESIHQKNLEYIPTLPSTYVLSMFACQCTAAKGQLISKCPFGVSSFGPKYQQKNLTNSALESKKC